MRLLHSPGKTSASFDDPNLVSHAGLVPVMALAERAGLGDLIAGHVRLGGECGVNARLKVPTLVAGMAAGAEFLGELARQAPLLPGAGTLAFIAAFTGRCWARHGCDLRIHVPCMFVT